MSETVFWDTSAFVALGSPRDHLHGAARQISKDLATRQARIVTTEAVLLEVGNAFSRHDVKQRGIRWMQAVLTSAERGEATIVPVDTGLWLRGWDLYQRRLDKDWGLVDCISFVVMRDQEIAQAFTADHHFAQAGFTCLLSYD